MKLVQHYNDLTEINQLRYGIGGSYSNNVAANLQSDLKKLEGEIKTRIAFTDVKDCYPETVKLMTEGGWKVGRRTRDWHSVHQGDSAMTLFYKIFPQNNSDPKDVRTRERATYPCHHSLSGSCSMGLIDNIDKDWLKSPSFPERYLTLVRLPLTKDKRRTAEEVAKMRYFRYRLVFRSDVARYFANGWKPEDYPKDDLLQYGQPNSRQFEDKSWNSKEAPKIAGFKYEPAK
jgi:hypothetical protein